jgi:hypothetical protein
MFLYRPVVKMSSSTHQDLCSAVQHNCHISDARHGTDYGLCTYLLKMREYYRWEYGLDYDESLVNESVGDWLTAREALWESVREDDYIPLPLHGRHYDPFNVNEINQKLESLGLVYSAGYGVKNKPLFFLGYLERREQPEGLSVWVSGRELARDLSSPAAMCQGGQIYIRQESFRRMLWEKLDNWRWHRADNALGRAFAYYDFQGRLEDSLNQMVEKELEVLLLHEKGEYLVGETLGGVWNDLLITLGHSPVEWMVRAVRDHWADCRVTLPSLIAQQEEASLHFYIGGVSGMRKVLFPRLFEVYNTWYERGNWAVLSRCVKEGEQHWSELACRILEVYRDDPDEANMRIKALVEARTL